MSAYQYDVAILGGGPGGYVAAIKAAQRGLSVALIEQAELGGTCLNIGCIPTKALLASAKVLETVREARDFGVVVEGVSIDYAKMQARKERVVKQLRGGVEFLMKKNAVTVYKGTGILTGRHQIGIAGEHEEEISANTLILASGSVASRPPIAGIDGANVVTSTELLSWPEVPASLAVIGGGAIGLEFASLFSALGAKVTVLEGLSQIMPHEDEEIAAELTGILKRHGLTLHVNAMVREIRDAEGKKAVVFSVNEREEQVTADVVLVATGRWPATEGCGYEAQGIGIDRRAVLVDKFLHTGVENIYAIGDAIGGMLLAHKASAEGALVIENIRDTPRAMEYHAIPSALYSSPAVASVGLCEAHARAQGLEVITGKFPFRAVSKATILGKREGFVKVVLEKATGVLVGCQAIGPEVTEMITEASMAVQHRLTARQFLHAVHPHPTLSEIFHEAVEAALGHPLHM